ncbi:MAG: metallophosphatase domain-containing protein [Planctomycetota bacterium]
MRLVVTSDTHNQHDDLVVPDGDVFVHAGDFTGHGSFGEVEQFGAWLGRLPHARKVVIAGNHEFAFEEDPARARAALGDVDYLEDSAVEIDGVRFWGSPWQPEFMGWAFNLPIGERLAAVWSRIPDDTDVLITHGPPQGILDDTPRGEAVGCPDLRRRVAAVRPRFHLFGHIHESFGEHEEHGTRFLNLSAWDHRAGEVRSPVVLDLEP